MSVFDAPSSLGHWDDRSTLVGQGDGLALAADRSHAAGLAGATTEKTHKGPEVPHRSRFVSRWHSSSDGTSGTFLTFSSNQYVREQYMHVCFSRVYRPGWQRPAGPEGPARSEGAAP